jgi:aryl-alcohol dehydrogenase-like predicted oxidoreductase
MIPLDDFGSTGHVSTRIIFGAYALYKATQAEADQVLALLIENGVNHIDVAFTYGQAERRVGPWMQQHRGNFFVGTKTIRRTYEGAWEDLHRSLERLRVDYVDLWQIHNLTSPQGWERAMGPGGSLEAFVEARDRGLARFLGVTGHGLKAPAMHLRSLERFDFDAVLLPYSHSLMQIPQYAADFTALASICRERNVAVQTIKSLARRSWGDRDKTHNTGLYQPLVDQKAVDGSVHWVLGRPGTFLISAGDMRLLPTVLDAAHRFEARPSDADMAALAAEYDIQPIFV